jgi:5-methylcytosine-specific restriction endonuclease McrA
MSERVPEHLKRAVVERAKHCCEYCRTPSRYSSDPLSVEHVVPQTRGGFSDPENLAAACQGCNNFKFIATHATDPVTGTTVPRYHPRQHAWNEHFSWNEDGTLILGRTPIGRATVERLRLNRPGVVNLRHVLQLAGRHPQQNSDTRDGSH